MDISNAIKIEGQGTTIGDLFWLAYYAARHKIIVELGSWLGRSTRALADNCDGIVYAIDDWYGPRNQDVTEAKRETCFEEFKRNMAGTKAIVKPMRFKHEALRDWKYEAPDMVFIDGAHDYESVKRDLSFWLAHAAPGALLSGHDGNYLTVAQAVYELLPNAEIAPGTSIWSATKGLT